MCNIRVCNEYRTLEVEGVILKEQLWYLTALQEGLHRKERKPYSALRKTLVPVESPEIWNIDHTILKRRIFFSVCNK